MAGMLRVPRSRGALNGVLLVLLGLWGGLIAFVGPYFHYAYTPDQGFTYTTGRLWLEILPAAGTVVGGLILGGTASPARCHLRGVAGRAERSLVHARRPAQLAVAHRRQRRPAGG